MKNWKVKKLSSGTVFSKKQKIIFIYNKIMVRTALFDRLIPRASLLEQEDLSFLRQG